MKQTINFFIKLCVLVLLFVACKEPKPTDEGQSNDAKINVQYNQKFRPQFHFSPPANWMNDPNGMVYYEGEYHLFYQYYPDDIVWGPMHWGHAVSEDLVHWENLPIALYPDEQGYIFSGSAVVDWNNSSGLGKDGQPALIAIYTYHFDDGEKQGRVDYQTQGLAFSLDKGRTWEKYAGNPILKNLGIKDFRDPKVFWFEEGEYWMMSLAVKDKISFYKSENLIDWEFSSHFNPEWAAYGGVWECPDLFPLEADNGEQKWCLLVSINPGGPNGGSATQYFIGDFDGENFKSTSNIIKWLDHGADNYAGVTWANVPKEDGRTLFIGWMSNWLYGQEVPTDVWRSAMTLPRSLYLFENEDDFYIASKPIEEVKKLRKTSKKWSTSKIQLENELSEIELTPTQQDFKLVFTNEDGDEVILEKSESTIRFDRSNSGNVAFSDDFQKVHEITDVDLSIKHIQIFVDRSSIEFFFNNGQMVITELIFPNSPFTRLKTFGISKEVNIHQLHSIWQENPTQLE